MFIDKNMYCVLICTYPRHFKYASNFIDSLIKNNIDFEKTEIYLSFDSKKDISCFQKLYPKYNLSNIVKYIYLGYILDKIDITYYESVKQIKKKKVINKNERNKWVAIKRSYSILYLDKLGYSYVMCLDSEGWCFKNFSLLSIFKKYVENNFLLVSDTQRVLKNNKIKKINISILKTFLNYNPKHKLHKKIAKCSVRQNDFWIIRTEYFKKCIQEITSKNRKPISNVLFICESWFYELWLYYNKLIGNIEIEVINFREILTDFNIPNYDFHGEDGLPSKFILDVFRGKNSKLEDDMVKLLNTFYFNKCQTWRGDYYKYLHKMNCTLCERLNIKLLSSNYQGR